jgi:two-component system, OmpR family, KDP operon response regulator KdpE
VSRGRILVVDDEPQILRALKTNLAAAGYEVVTASTAEEAVAIAAAKPPDALILDLVLPDRSGTEVTRELRTWTSVPIVLLSAVGDENEKVEALDAGADDYVTKPFGMEELLARLRASLRRGGPPNGPVIELGMLTLDLQIGDDYARAASDLRLRVEELERETVIAHSNAQFLQRRMTQAEERAGELEELTESLRAQRERLETYCEQQRARAERSESAAAAMRAAGGELLSAHDRKTHSPEGTRGFARGKVEYADALERLRSALEDHAGERYLGPDTGDQVRRFFTDETLAGDEKRELRQAITRSLEPKRD